MRRLAFLFAAAVPAAMMLAGCAESAGGNDAGSSRVHSLVEMALTFTHDGQGARFGAEAHFARFREGEHERAAMLLGLGREGDIPLDGCMLIDAAEELDRAFSGEATADVELLDAGRLAVRGPEGATLLQPHRYPDLTPEIRGVAYGAGGAAPLSFVPGAVYEVLGEGGEAVGPFSAAVVAPRTFPTLEAPVALRRGQDLELRWAEAGEASDPVLASVEWTTRAGAREVRCRVRDDGAFAVPQRLLSSFPAPSQVVRAEVTVTRARRARLAAPNAGTGELRLGLREVAPLVEVVGAEPR